MSENKINPIKETLIAMYKMYQDGLEWHQGTFFRDKNGLVLSVNSTKENIHSACLLGCLSLVKLEDYMLHHNVCLKIKEEVKTDVATYNDFKTTCKNSVLNMLQKVIDNCK